VNFFLGRTFKAEEGNNAKTPAMECKGRTIPACVVVGQGQNFHAPQSGGFRKRPGRQIQGPAGRKAGMIVEVSAKSQNPDALYEKKPRSAQSNTKGPG
jgi:hypothetical protein